MLMHYSNFSGRVFGEYLIFNLILNSNKSESLGLIQLVISYFCSRNNNIIEPLAILTYK